MLATDSLPAVPTLGGHAPRHRRRHSGWARVVEAGAVVLSPLVAYFVLRIRGMAPVELPDPSMHTVYIVDPREMFIRYSAALEPTARLREGAQVGFLVVARLFYVAFGAVPGFFATRYLFALIAIVPAYMLLRRLYGIPAGALVIVALLSSPVIITAWGTDYPNSAVVSYIAGAVACLAMPCRGRWRSACLVLAGVLLTMAIWSHGMGIVLAGTTVAVYAAVRVLRAREHMFRDGAVLAGVSVLATLALMVASALIFGQFDFIRPTFAAAAYLNRPAEIRLFHSVNWRWAPYVAYLLVPPSVIVTFAVTFARKLRAVPTPQLFVGLVCAAQFAVFAYLQFGYHVESLEMYYFSSTLWGVTCLALAVILAELCRSPSTRHLAALAACPRARCPPSRIRGGPARAGLRVVADRGSSGRGPGRVQRWPAVGQARRCGALGFPRRAQLCRGNDRRRCSGVLARPHGCAKPCAPARFRSGPCGRPGGPVLHCSRWQRQPPDRLVPGQRRSPVFRRQRHLSRRAAVDVVPI